VSQSVISMKKVGFWRPSPSESRHHAPGSPELMLPWPGDLVDVTYDPALRELVASYLGNPKFRSNQYRGSSTCRLCGRMNGSADFTDYTYVWPEGYLHYVRDHGVRPPQDLADHIKKRPVTFVGPVGLPPVRVAAMQLAAGSPEVAKHTLQSAGLLGPHTDWARAKKLGAAREAVASEIDKRQCMSEPVPGSLVASLARMETGEERALDGRPDLLADRSKAAKRLLAWAKQSGESLNQHARRSHDLIRDNRPLRLTRVVGSVDVTKDWTPSQYMKLADFMLANYAKGLRPAVLPVRTK